MIYDLVTDTLDNFEYLMDTVEDDFLTDEEYDYVFSILENLRELKASLEKTE